MGYVTKEQMAKMIAEKTIERLHRKNLTIEDIGEEVKAPIKRTTLHHLKRGMGSTYTINRMIEWLDLPEEAEPELLYKVNKNEWRNV